MATGASEIFESHDHALQAAGIAVDGAGNRFVLIGELQGNATDLRVRKYTHAMTLVEEKIVTAFQGDKFDAASIAVDLTNGDVLVFGVAHEPVSTSGRRDEGSFAVFAGWGVALTSGPAPGPQPPPIPVPPPPDPAPQPPPAPIDYNAVGAAAANAVKAMLTAEFANAHGELYGWTAKLVKNAARTGIADEVAAGTLLTPGNLGAAFYADPKVYERINETAYEADKNAIKDSGKSAETAPPAPSSN